MLLVGRCETVVDPVCTLEGKLIDQMWCVVVVVDRPPHRHGFTDALLALGTRKRELVAKFCRGHPTAHVDTDDVRDDAVGQWHRKADGCARTRMRVRHHPHRLGKGRMVDELLNLVETILLDKRLVVDQHACSRVLAAQFDCHSAIDSSGVGFRLFEVWYHEKRPLGDDTPDGYSTVTLLARFRGLSIDRPSRFATW